ncbi:ASCH/PUA domain-containing protein [Aeromonas caviae]|uniref:ASCH/PUA domain-containing protein n=1 Tax=Aeromonas caviae TaxID=648 RepID=UPI0029D4EC99|nr:ASCH/PUA domain-containing protein [Aeromonas caviae]MDX7735837.1 ASCH/PUA domain-containing protein [Aeromonas caviae]
MKHELKIKPEYFAAVVTGEKTFEIRNNSDRNFQVGDTLVLKSWDGEFNGNFVERTVSYITDFEQKPGYVVLGLANKRDQELAEQLADATRQCGVMAELLREAIGEVPQTQSFPSRCDAALAGKLPHQQDLSLLDFAVTSWHQQVAHRPMENVYRRTLDSVWRQVIRFAGEDPQSIIGPSHDDLLHKEQKQEGGSL